jgi:hypothetical protein
VPRDRGEVPCPYFGAGCSCAALPHRAFIAALLSGDEHAAELQLYEESLRALGAITEREEKQRKDDEERRRQKEGLPAKVRELVSLIKGEDGPMMRGQTVSCPVSL